MPTNRPLNSVSVKIKKLHPEAVTPSYQTPGAAGFDLHALEDISIEPGQTKLIKTGLSFEIPKGLELQVRPRSGTSLKTTLRVANSPGTVDSDYRGEVCVIMTNTARANDFMQHRENIVNVAKGERIAQGVICPVFQAVFQEIEELSETERGAGGFGSTGK